MTKINFDIRKPSMPLVMTAIHEGHELRREAERRMFIDEITRYREEDPYTGFLASINPNRIINWISRFEVDVNRPRNKAIYRTPEDAWGLKVWKNDVPETLFNRSLEIYDYFYQLLAAHLKRIIGENGYAIVYDIHSYNDKRNGEADPQQNPDVNIGTGLMNRALWNPVADQIIHKLSDYDFYGRNLDVRENVKFRGGYMSDWIHRTFNDRAAVFAIEFKKFFMNEQTGHLDLEQLFELKTMLQESLDPVLEEAGKTARILKPA